MALVEVAITIDELYELGAVAGGFAGGPLTPELVPLMPHLPEVSLPLPFRPSTQVTVHQVERRVGWDVFAHWLPADVVDQLAAWITTRRLGPDDLLFATREGTPISRNTFRTRVWLPAVRASGVDFPVRVHDLRHAHASWLLAGGSDLKSVMDRMGHAQITTTQKYLHALPGADAKNLTALDLVRGAATRRRAGPAT